jgi:hypothetical protein
MTTKQRPQTVTQGIHQMGRAVIGEGEQAISIFTGSAAPSDGTSGTGAGVARPGSLYIRADTTNSKLYINTNTTASPTWTAVGAQS